MIVILVDGEFAGMYDNTAALSLFDGVDGVSWMLYSDWIKGN